MFDISKCPRDKDGNYLAQTRDGRLVTFALINGRLVGCIGNHDSVLEWNHEGERPFPGKSILDLINIPEPKRSGEVWVNFYPNGNSGVCSSREYADKCAYVGRLACVRVPWTEGDGLEAGT